MLLSLELFFALAGLLLAGAAYKGSTQAWRFDQQPIDLAMRVMSGFWIAYVAASLAQAVAVNQDVYLQRGPEYLQAIVFEFLLGSTVLFLLAAASAVRPWILAVVALQLLGGLLELGCRLENIQLLDAVLRCWVVLKLVVAGCVAVCIARQVRHTRSRRSWLALSACAMGLGIWMFQAVAQSDTSVVLPIGWYLYAFFLFVVWKLVSLNPDADKRLAHAGTSFEGTSSCQPLSSLTGYDDLVLLAVRGERQRIACELHDNVGSQIVSILFAMQSANQPKKQFVMLSLEQCLSDLKTTVDAIEGFDENVTLSLGRLRYRLQPALDRHAINMCWTMELCDGLDAVRGIYAQQVLRIAQESLANVMRHARATSVSLVCRYVPEFCHLSLEVCDDGVGFSKHHSQKCSGRGLLTMKRRASAVGGFLTVSSPRAGGTLVRLILPLPHLKTSGLVGGTPSVMTPVGVPVGNLTA